MPTDLAPELAALSRCLSTVSDETKGTLTRIVSELDFANRLCELHPEQSQAWAKLVERSLALVKKAVEGGKLDGLKSAVEQAEALLQPIARTAKSYTIWNAGHGHIDMNWMWSWPETVSVTNDTFTTVLKLMEAYPDFCYSQSQVSVYEIARQFNPELFERIKERVKEGRWEVTASTWVENDKNLTGGETMCRHLLYARRYLEEQFGLKPEDVVIDWSPDTFGHAHSIPSFLVRGGVRRYYHCRTGIGEARPPVFWWQAPDGSRVIVYKEVSYSWYNGQIEPGLITPAANFWKETGLREWLNVYGVGDHGGGPTRRDIERAHELTSWPIFPKFILSTTKPFYETLEKQGDRWPVLDKELNFEFTGCYTTQTRIKKANRFSEQLLYQAEAASSLAWALLKKPYPTRGMQESWIRNCFSQFHDILPGSGVRETREYNQGQFQETAAAAGAATTNALRAIAAQVDTKSVAADGVDTVPGHAAGAGAGFQSGLGQVSSYDGAAQDARPFVVFNLNAWERNEVVEATLWDVNWNEITVSDEKGKTCAAQVMEKGHFWGHTFVKVAFPALNIPSLGYRTYLLREGRAEPAKTRLKTRGRGIVENEFVRVGMDWLTGGIKSLVERETKADLADPDRPMGVLEYALERHHGMSAWVIGDFMKMDRLTDLTELSEKPGPYAHMFSSKLRLNESTFTVRTIVRAGDPRVELVIQTNWLERGYPEKGVPNLRLVVPVNVRKRRARYEMPYGTIERDLFAGEEVPTQRFVDLSGKLDDAEAGLTILNDYQYGCSVEKSTVRMTLIRSSYEPDPLPEIGEHTIRIGLLPHGKDWCEADAVRAGVNFNQPLIVVGTDVHEGKLPPKDSYLSVDAPNVILCALKKAEDSDAMILRLYETAGKDTDVTMTLSHALASKSAVEVDLLERAVRPNGATLKGGKVMVSVPKYGIASVRVGK